MASESVEHLKLVSEEYKENIEFMMNDVIDKEFGENDEKGENRCLKAIIGLVQDPIKYWSTRLYYYINVILKILFFFLNQFFVIK